MRLHCVLLAVAVFILARCSASATSDQTKPSKVIFPRLTQSKGAAQGDSDDSKRFLRGDKDDEERTFNDEIINQYLHLFEDWARNNQTPEYLFMYLGLPRIMKRAYKKGNWNLLLQNQNYIMYRKYEKYLHLLKNGEH
ncbi:hypothetical protein PR003_g15158 [Phytophthora rubi]|uniref:RxLR effector protein n=1 Tax=Phytophthora rubi TaxID=129364 RepID=A0A6A4F9X3_9STRA|nr:hypothetical protein PR003_g15158 [Phytophthora rubi]